MHPNIHPQSPKRLWKHWVIAGLGICALFLCSTGSPYCGCRLHGAPPRADGSAGSQLFLWWVPLICTRLDLGGTVADRCCSLAGSRALSSFKQLTDQWLIVVLRSPICPQSIGILPLLYYIFSATSAQIFRAETPVCSAFPGKRSCTTWFLSSAVVWHPKKILSHEATFII